MPGTVLSPLCAFFLFSPQGHFMKVVFHPHLRVEGTDAARKRQGEAAHLALLNSTTLLFSLIVLSHFPEASVEGRRTSLQVCNKRLNLIFQRTS